MLFPGFIIHFKNSFNNFISDFILPVLLNHVPVFYLKEPVAVQSFVEWCEREETQLIGQIEAAIEGGKIYEAASLVGQRKQFAKMRTQLTQQIREEQQHVRFEEAKGARGKR